MRRSITSVSPPRSAKYTEISVITGTSPFASFATARSLVDGTSLAYTFFARMVHADTSSIDPGTSAVSTPAAPMVPRTHGPKLCFDTESSARSASLPSRPGTARMAANPVNNTNRSTSW